MGDAEGSNSSAEGISKGGERLPTIVGGVADIPEAVASVFGELSNDGGGGG